MAKKKEDTKQIQDKAIKDTKKKTKAITKDKSKETKKKRTTTIEVCSEEWLRDYFKEGAPTGMTFAMVKDTEFMQLIQKNATKRGHTRKTDGKYIKSKTKFEPIPVEHAIAHLKKFKLVVIRQVEGKRPNWFKIIAKKTAEKKGLL